MMNCELRKFKVSVIILGFIDYCVKYSFILLYSQGWGLGGASQVE